MGVKCTLGWGKIRRRRLRGWSEEQAVLEQSSQEGRGPAQFISVTIPRPLKVSQASFQASTLKPLSAAPHHDTASAKKKFG